jgi:ribosomal protein S18 acetylase RimI-like enzyme
MLVLSEPDATTEGEMAAEPIQKTRRQPGAGGLEPFVDANAALVATWIRDAREAYWLAPHSPPPITAGSVLRWKLPGRHAFQLMEAGAPVGYGEINLLNAERAEYWLGHLIVDPGHRGRHFGVRLVRGLVRIGVERFQARRISLVVFEHNEDAIACYRAAGLREDGREVHRFPAYNTCESLIRMIAV